MAVVRLADYRPAPYLLQRTDLTVRLFADHALVAARLAFHQRPEAGESDAEGAPLELRGVDLELLSLALDGVPLPPEDYLQEDDRLILHRPPPGAFVIESEVRLRPQANTTLEGLYVSGGMVTTQCEAEGFRRITFHPDRPDLLSRFRVRIEADRASLPGAALQRQLRRERRPARRRNRRGAPSLRRLGRSLPQALLSVRPGGGPAGGGPRQSSSPPAGAPCSCACTWSRAMSPSPAMPWPP